MPMIRARGYTLIELIVAIGLFAIVMMLVSGAYLTMIGINREAQNITTGIDNISFALESMTHSIRTGSHYSCGLGPGGGDCASGGNAFTYIDEGNQQIEYFYSNNIIYEKINSKPAQALTDVTQVYIKSLTFTVSGSAPASAGDAVQANVKIVVQGTVAPGGKSQKDFTLETMAAMRGADI